MSFCRVCDGCCIFCLNCEARGCRCSCMRSMSVPGPASSRPRFFYGVESVVRGNADSLLNRAVNHRTSTTGTLNDLTTDLIMANNKYDCFVMKMLCFCLVCILWQSSMLSYLQFVYAGGGCALNEFSPLSSFVIRCRFGYLIIHCRQPERGGILFA